MTNVPMDNRFDPPRPLKTSTRPPSEPERDYHMVASRLDGALTLCGIMAGPGPVTITGAREHVTCPRCIELMGG